LDLFISLIFLNILFGLTVALVLADSIASFVSVIFIFIALTYD